jgi:hypothetical protein
VAVIHGDSFDGKDLTLLDAFVTSPRDFISYGTQRRTVPLQQGVRTNFRALLRSG